MTPSNNYRDGWEGKINPLIMGLRHMRSLPVFLHSIRITFTKIISVIHLYYDTFKNIYHEQDFFFFEIVIEEYRKIVPRPRA